MIKCALIAAIAMTASIATTEAADKVSVRLNWVLSGAHTGLYLGKDRGYFADEGIDLVINEGRGSGLGAQLTANKEETFGMIDPATLILSVSKGMPLKAALTMTGSSTFSVVSLAEAPIAKPSDLVGKRVASTPGDALTKLFPALLAANKIDKDKVQMAFMDPAAKISSLLQKKIDGLLGAADAQYVTVQENGAKATNLYFADYGVDTIGLVMAVHEDTIKTNLDMLRRFGKAYRRSLEAMVKEPEAAVDAGMKAKPDLKRETLLAQLKISLERTQSQAGKSKPLGENIPEDWNRTLEILKQYGDINTDQPATAFYTNDLVAR